MATNKYYVVKKGRVPGIYLDWPTCKQQVDGFSGALYKGFSNFYDAEVYLNTYNPDCATVEKQADSKDLNKDTNPKSDFAFVDGSYNAETGRYGYGGFLVTKNEKIVLQGSGIDLEMSSMRNVAGEILGSQAAITAAIQNNLKEVVIYYDYAGIEHWATGEWKRNKKGTQEYYEFIQEAKKKINICFVKVKGHSGVEGNEEADRLAKEAVGIK